MARTRDYKAEYRHRIEHAGARGLSRPQARGHAGRDEAPIRLAPIARGNEQLETAVKALYNTGSLTRAAKAARMSPERLRRLVREHSIAERAGRTWTLTDTHPRELMVLTQGQRRRLTLPGFEPSSLVGRHLAAVQRFVETNDISLLAPFAGRSVIDANGQEHLLETRPNVLHRLASDGESFPEIYRFVN